MTATTGTDCGCESPELRGWARAVGHLVAAGVPPQVPEDTRRALWRCGGWMARAAERAADRANYWVAIADARCQANNGPDQPVRYQPT